MLKIAPKKKENLEQIFALASARAIARELFVDQFPGEILSLQPLSVSVRLCVCVCVRARARVYVCVGVCVCNNVSAAACAPRIIELSRGVLKV